MQSMSTKNMQGSAFKLLLLFCISVMSIIANGSFSSEDEQIKQSMAEALNLSIAINKILKNYDKKLRPNAGGKPVLVKVEFKVISFGEIKEVSMIYVPCMLKNYSQSKARKDIVNILQYAIYMQRQYSMDIFFRQWWDDPRFAHNFSQPFTMAADPAKMFWTPDTYFWNVKSSKYHHVTRENMRIMLYPDGRVYFSTRITLTAQCDMDLRLYPMDTQKCFLRIESYAHTVADVDYTWKGGKSQGIEIVSKEMAQFELLKMETSTRDSTNSKGSFASLKATFTFRRRLEYFVSSVFVPAIVLVVLSWCCFFISPSAVPARIALGITTILTTILLSSSVNSNMPKVSYMKALDYFLLTSFGFIFAAMAEYILVLNTNTDFSRTLSSMFPSLVKEHPPTEDKIAMMQDRKSDIVVKMDEHSSPKSKSNHDAPRKKQQVNGTKDPTKKCHWIDFAARFIFPSCYTMFLISYWVYYDNLRNKDPVEV